MTYGSDLVLTYGSDLGLTCGSGWVLDYGFGGSALPVLGLEVVAKAKLGFCLAILA